MMQILNSLGIFALAAATSFTGWPRMHVALLSLATLIDSGIVIILEGQRAVVARAPGEMSYSPIAVLHIVSSAMAFLLVWACLVAAIRRLVKTERVHVLGIAMLTAALILRGLSYGTSWLMKLI